MKKHILKIHPFAESDLTIASEWYASQKENLDREFIEEIEKTILRIQQNPQQFACIRKKIRLAVVKRFPYGIYFFTTGNVVHVIAIIHFSRNPKILRKRLK